MQLLNFSIGLNQPFFLIAGPCVIESEALVMEVAETLQQLTQALGIPYIFKASFDKANRTSLKSFRGPGVEQGLAILERVKTSLQIPVLTDVHEDSPIEDIAQVVDILQTPAFLCRQTNFLLRVARCGKPVNIKKGQFLSPWEMEQVVHKAQSTGNKHILVCERGYTFGYNNLITDMRSLVIMRAFNCPVVFDATHSVQMPGAQQGRSGGLRQMIPPLARAAIAVGIDGLFMETHPNPDQAMSDGPNSFPLAQMPSLLTMLQTIDKQVKSEPWLEDSIENFV